jgi:threonine/homoserine/homoserine lactone efflux protein
MEVIINGIEFGLVLALLVGPVFFAILQASVERGFWTGVRVAVGVSLSDTLYVLVCYFGLSAAITRPGVAYYMGIVGGMILLAFGAYYLFVKTRGNSLMGARLGKARTPLMFVFKGFLINTMSPLVPLFWIGAASVATIDLAYTSAANFWIFFVGVLGTILATDIAKAYLAGRLQAWITPRSLMIMNLVVGAAMVFYGIRLIYTSLQAA